MTDVRLLAGALAAGIPLSRALDIAPDGAKDESVIEIVRLSAETGIPRSRALTALADSMDESARRERRISVGSASAVQSSRILVALPALTLAGSELSGFAPTRFLFTSTFGGACVALGVTLVALAWWWMKRIRRSVPNEPRQLGLALNLAADIARTSALTPERFRRIRLLAENWATTAELDGIGELRALSREYGIPIANLFDIEAERLRREAAFRLDTALELLPGKLLAPVGACLFPAFVFTTVVPTVAGMAGQFTS